MSRLCTRQTADSGNVTAFNNSRIRTFCTAEFFNLRNLFFYGRLRLDFNRIGLNGYFFFGSKKLNLVTVCNFAAEKSYMRNLAKGFVVLNFKNYSAQILGFSSF